MSSNFPAPVPEPTEPFLNHYPSVSVGLPVFNEEEHIYDILQSIHLQKYPNIEVLISDNASVDGTWDIIADFVNKDNRFKGVRQAENMGAVENFLYVLNSAKGEFFIWAAGHDLWGPDMIESLVFMFQNNPSMALCAPRTKWIGDDGNVLFEKKTYIDTRPATTPAGRVLLFLKQRERCNAIYGLHRREILLKTIPWPNENDLIGLCRIAFLGDIITDLDSYWCRRNLKRETVSEQMARYTKVFRRSGINAKFPYLIGTLTALLAIVKFSGNFSDRLRLISYFLGNITLNPANIKALVSDTIEGFSRR